MYGDSALIIHQALRKWKIKEERLIPYLNQLQKLADRFESVKFLYIPRNQNSFADALATLASMVEIPEGMNEVQISIEQRDKPAFCLAIEIEGVEMVDPSTWYYDIWRVLKEGVYPEGANRKTRVAP